MISQKYIKSLEFETLEDVFNYIVESEIVGAISQCKELIKKLSDEQFKEFFVFLNDFQYMNNNEKEQIELKNKLFYWRFEK